MIFYIRKTDMPNTKRSANRKAVTAPIAEKELIVYCQAGIVEYLRLISVSDDGKCVYHVLVKRKSSDDEHLLITHNTKLPRPWSSLDRAVNHMRSVYHYEGRVYLDLKLEKLDESNNT
jgi:hypothetical protein